MIKNIHYQLRKFQQAGGLLGVSSSIVHQKRVVLNNAQIKALPTTPITMVPEVEGISIFPLGGVLIYDNTEVYTNVAHSAIDGLTFLWFDHGAFCSLRSHTTNLILANTGSEVRRLKPFGGSQFAFNGGSIDVTSGAQTAGEPASGEEIGCPKIRFGIDNYSGDYNDDQGDFTGGHSNNKLIIAIAYMLLNKATGEFK